MHLRRFLMAFLCAVTVWPGLVLAQKPQVFVPKADAEVAGVVVILEHHLIERKTSSVAGRRLADQFAKKMEFGFRQMVDNSVVNASAYCEVILRDWGQGEPNFKISCLAAGQSIPFERLPETLDEVLAELKAWIAEHKKRSERSRMRPAPTRSQTARMA